VLPFASPTRQLPAEGHEIVVRLAPGAIAMALDQLPAGPLVVEVVDCVLPVGAPEWDGDELQLEATNETAASATTVNVVRYDAAPLSTTAGPAGRSPRAHDGATTCRGR